MQRRTGIGVTLAIAMFGCAAEVATDDVAEVADTQQAVTQVERHTEEADADYDGNGLGDTLIVTNTGSYEYLGTGDSNDPWDDDRWIDYELRLNSVTYTRGRFNDDDIIDLLVTTAEGTSLYLGQPEGVFLIDVWKKSSWTREQASFEVCDYNGDGIDDLLVMIRSGSFSGTQQYLGTADGGFTSTSWFRSDLHPSATLYNSADFNGDGRCDTMITTGVGVFEYLGSSPSGFVESVYERYDLNHANTRLTTGYFNNDNMADLIITTHVGSFMYLGAPVGFVANIWEDWNLRLGQVRFVTGDFNRDGRTDVLVQREGITTQHHATSTGAFTEAVWSTPDYPLSTTLIHSNDYSGDRRSDILVQNTFAAYLRFGKSTGVGFSSKRWERFDLPRGQAEFN